MKVNLNYKPQLSVGHLALFVFLDHKSKKAVTILAGVLDPNQQKEVGLLLHNSNSNMEHR